MNRKVKTNYKEIFWDAYSYTFVTKHGTQLERIEMALKGTIEPRGKHNEDTIIIIMHLLEASGRHATTCRASRP